MTEVRRRVEEEVATLRRVVNDQQQESQSRQSMLEEKIQELITRTLPRDSSKWKDNLCLSKFSLIYDIK